ncbi:hypothetical protein Pd630_LPD16128 (plasmid) [Rhodococcus opacus PD630]|nr:hypothetical protein Pd630_LPD16128 [Rhodococcus opacus PD630]
MRGLLIPNISRLSIAFPSTDTCGSCYHRASTVFVYKLN